MSVSQKLSTNLRVLVTRSEVPGEWVSHCLDLDVVSQGCSVESALEMLREAVLLCVDDDLADGRVPPLGGRQRAPSEYLETWGKIMMNGTQVEQLDKVAAPAVAAILRVELELVAVPISAGAPEKFQARTPATRPASDLSYACV
ncbi:MAG: type II toxin-antitoxin system HicB family antitoxin [Polyangiaceae bacterium]|nr:type II toxin-antitoxin system HicB family antitoxin [Polyangiaceae bacterium]